jgi:hypothetical protein
MKRSVLALFALAAGTAPHAGAQVDSAKSMVAAGGPAVRRISTASALSTEQLGSINSVRALPGGRVLVNDGTRRRLLLMDSTLKTIGVVLDSLTDVVNAYGTRAGVLIPEAGDSTLWIDPASYAVLVLDPRAHIARVRSIPRVRDVNWIANPGMYGWAGVDARHHLVYRIPAEAGPPAVQPPRGVPYFPQDPDSGFVVSIDFDTRVLDTLGSVRTPKEPYIVKRNANGGLSVTRLANPMPVSDDWAVMSDGTVAFVRWQDYRIEYRAADGTITSSPKLPYPWQHLDDEAKQHLTDSIGAAQRKLAMTSYVTSVIRWVNLYKQSYPKNFAIPQGFVPTNGLPRDWKLPHGATFPATYIYGCAAGEEPSILTATQRPSCIPQPATIPGNTPVMPTMRETSVMPWQDLPDYRPPFGQGAVRADADDNLWVRTAAQPGRGAPVVYDVVNRKGELFDRLQLPPGYTLVGFGPGRVAYLSMRDARGIHLARVRLR